MTINQIHADKIFLNSSSIHSHCDCTIFIQEITITATAIHQIKIAEKSTKIFAIDSKAQIFQKSALLFHKIGSTASAIFQENEIKTNHKIANQKFVQNFLNAFSASAHTEKITANKETMIKIIEIQTMINFIRGTKVQVK